METQYDGIEDYLPEFYGQSDNQVEDIHYILGLLTPAAKLDILEPLCGTGRLLIPLARACRSITGLGHSPAMLKLCRDKMTPEPNEVKDRVKLVEMDVCRDDWGKDAYDAVILGAKALFQLNNAEEQEHCIRCAAKALRKGGRLYLENDNIEGPVPDYFGLPGQVKRGYPSGLCADGTELKSKVETLSVNQEARVWYARKTIKATLPNGKVLVKEMDVQTHPVSAPEAKDWLLKYNFEILHKGAGADGTLYKPHCGRVVFWAKKR